MVDAIERCTEFITHNLCTRLVGIVDRVRSSPQIAQPLGIQPHENAK
jgi:hypothetical protein